MLKPYKLVHGQQVYVERRRYSAATYTWAYIELAGEWVQLGDPWPSIFPRGDQLAAEVARAVQERMAVLDEGLGELHRLEAML